MDTRTTRRITRSERRREKFDATDNPTEQADLMLASHKRRTRGRAPSFIKEEIGFDKALQQALTLSLQESGPPTRSPTSCSTGTGDSHAAPSSESPALKEFESRPERQARQRSPVSKPSKTLEIPRTKKRKLAHSLSLEEPPHGETTIKQPSDAAITKKLAAKEARYAAVAARNDHLLHLPPTNGQIYVNKRGVLVRSRNDDPYNAHVNDAPPHPKIIQAEKAGTLTREKLRWYKDMAHDVNIPVAGIPSDKPWRPKLDYSAVFAPGVLDRDMWRSLDRIPTLTFGPVEFIMKHKELIDDLQEDAFHQRPSIKIHVPDLLKGLLVDDWENITKNNQLVPLPHPNPVTKLLNDYLEYEKAQRQEGSAAIDILEETVSGLREYFDKCLGRILLYRFERPQYAQIREKWNDSTSELFGKTACDTYGAEHLMRLMTSLPELVAQTNMDQQSVNRLREELAKLCQWLEKNAAEYFLSEYETPAADYPDKPKN
ncbi:uncharacterized protein JN550_012350 [Neoarthrinium moseri]|uniref:uncharacterized protein n=1 Tax=Neoarthrinium moseri TaxID=1658444 RepID=UPI001FDC2B37|nr:uncharacterized protein JN550_012350 [Neoarthrinium moseri]KAI1858891.1 hypothetical protein JN550_012350 [Neoarthrinium moseri]